MKPITMNKETLRQRIQENRDQHEAIFNEAVDGYKAEALRLLEHHIERIREGKIPAVRIILPVPENHLEDYDRVLDMLDMALGDTIEIDEPSFSDYVRDAWPWKNQFITSNSSYSATAARMSGE